MLRPVWLWLLWVGLGSLLVEPVVAPNPEEPPERSRPYAVLRGQNLGERLQVGGPQGGPCFCRFQGRGLARAGNSVG
jgi:hypothetical protein